MAAVDIRDNLLGISWVDSSWIPILNSGSVLDYFSERSNPFYDRTCNNEVVKMQRLTLEHLNQMVGVEYILLHAQEPILFIIRKQQRQSPTQVIPLADYYIIAGVIYQAPDLGSVINSRVLTAVHGIQSAFDEAMSYCRYHPSKGYWWHFKDHEEQDKVKPKVKRKEEPSSIFQRQRVDALLLDLRQKFPPKFVQVHSLWTKTYLQPWSTHSCQEGKQKNHQWIIKSHVRGPLTVVASPVAEHSLQTHRLSGYGSRTQPLCGTWDPPGPGHEPVSPAPAGGLSTTVPPGKPGSFLIGMKLCYKNPIKNGQKTYMDISPKKTCRWPTGPDQVTRFLAT
ncbi:mediator of RNA polymerase II transcription subunit 6 isoform X2 [Kogia breviceps]|uniref:mediator of RNA polymerase II transcription subunit 6 isoform X2 n=1 Tax=Kogia breviceps TaxID=27615 RepID=UPI0034D17785